MSCSWWIRVVQNRLDGEPLSAWPAAEEHLAGCRSCRRALAAADLLRAGMARLPRPAPSPELGDRILQAVAADRRARDLHRLPSPRLLLGMAAALLFCVSAFLLRGMRDTVSPGPDQPGQTARAGIPTPGEPGRAPEAPPDIPRAPFEEDLAQEDLWKEAGTALTALTTRAAGETVGQGRLLIPVVSPPVVRIGLAEPVTDSSTQPLVQAGHAVSAGLEPMTTSALRAVDLFLRDYSPAGLGGSSGL